MGYCPQGYHICQSAVENVAEYRIHSPAWDSKFRNIPLLTHTNKNDEDLNVLDAGFITKSSKAEVKNLITKYSKIPLAATRSTG